MTLLICWWSYRLMMKKELLLKNHTLIQTRMVKIDTLFQTKTALKPYPLTAAYTYLAYIREYPHPLRFKTSLYIFTPNVCSFVRHIDSF